MQLRTQYDDLQPEASQLATIDCSDMPDRTRQEDKADTDINILWLRYAGNIPNRHTIYGTETDFTADLQTMKEAVREMEDGWDKLPPHLKQMYNNFEDIFKAIQTGELKDLTNPPTPPIVTPPTPTP